MWAPEGLFHYSRDGRSATDGDDQQQNCQKKMAMAERRICRNGTKGILWGVDRAFTNGHIMERFLAPEDTSAHLLADRYTKVRRPPSCPPAQKYSISRPATCLPSLRSPSASGGTTAGDAVMLRPLENEVLITRPAVQCRDDERLMLPVAPGLTRYLASSKVATTPYALASTSTSNK